MRGVKTPLTILGSIFATLAAAPQTPMGAKRGRGQTAGCGMMSYPVGQPGLLAGAPSLKLGVIGHCRSW